MHTHLGFSCHNVWSSYMEESEVGEYTHISFFLFRVTMYCRRTWKRVRSGNTHTFLFFFFVSQCIVVVHGRE